MYVVLKIHGGLIPLRNEFGTCLDLAACVV